MHGTEQCIEKRWVLRRSAPLRPISLPQDQSLPAHRSSLLNGAGPSQRPFPRPQRRLPLRSFHSGVNGPGLLLRDLPACSPPGPPSAPRLHWFAPVDGRFLAFSPLRFTSPGALGCFLCLHSPPGRLPPRDRSVQQIPPLCGSPSEYARCPFAPR